MNTLILKLGATGDVVRTTPLLSKLDGHVTWITAEVNLPLLQGVSTSLRPLAWDDRQSALDRRYDLAINLEDDERVAEFLARVRFEQLFGAYRDKSGRVVYTADAAPWFDLSLISAHGRERADELKYLNRRTYQELIFAGLGFKFRGEPYMLPAATRTSLEGDVAVAPVAGPVWPMKNWAYYDALTELLRKEGFKVNVLPRRSTLLEHLDDVQSHRCLISGDSLPMHFALGTQTRCVSLFTCTSPWEIYGYDVQHKIVSPLLGEFFYKRGNDLRATTAVSLDEVAACVLSQLQHEAIPATTP